MVTESREALAARFAAAKAELVATGLPADVVDAALRPLWRSIEAVRAHAAAQVRPT